MKREGRISVPAAGGAILMVVLWVVAYIWARFLNDCPSCLSGWLARYAPVAFIVSLFGALLLGFSARRELWVLLRLFSAREWLFVAGIVGMALLGRWLLVPSTERVYFDEHVYVQVARSIADNGEARIATCGIVEDGRLQWCQGKYGHWPVGWPTIMAVAGRLVGFPHWLGMALNLAVSLVAVLLIALLSRLLFDHSGIALCAAAIYACLPANNLWSRTGASEVSAAFVTILALVLVLASVQQQSGRVAVLAALALAVAVQLRNEMIIVVGVAILVVTLYNRRWALRGFIWPGMLTVGLLLVHALHLGLTSRHYEPGVEGAGFAFSHVPANLTALADYVVHEPITLGCFVLALIGLVKLRADRAGLFLSLWLVVVFVIPLFHFGGSVALPGGERFLLSCLAPLALLAGVGLHEVSAPLQKVMSKRRIAFASVVVLAVGLYWSGVRATAEDPKTAVPRNDCAFLRSAIARIGSGSLMVTSDPAVVLAKGASAVLLTGVVGETGSCSDLVDHWQGGKYYLSAPSMSPAKSPLGIRAQDALFEKFRHDIVMEQETTTGERRVLWRLSKPNSL